MTTKRELIIRGIREVSFSLNEQFFVPDPNKLVKIELTNHVGINVDIKHMNLTLGAYFHYDDSPHKLAEMSVSNYFELPFMDEYKKEGTNVVLPVEVVIDAFRESISHLRALFCQKLAGTVYQTVVIPLDDPLVVVSHFFPSLIRKPEGQNELILQPAS
jgi:hypothetical protein